jgi:hypothetical protein
MRFQSITATIEAGLVFLPEKAPWRDEYLHELMMFPASRHDDQVDSTSQALLHLKTLTGIEAWCIAREERRRQRGQEWGNCRRPARCPRSPLS